MVRRHLIHQFNQFATTIDHTGLKTHDELGRAKICKNRTGIRSFQVYLCLESRKLEHTQPADLAESCLPKSAREVSSQRRRWCPSRSSYQQQPLHPSILLLHDADVVLRRRDAPRAFLLPHSLASRAWHSESNDTPTTEVECTSLLLPLPPDQITLHNPVSPFLISVSDTKIVQHGGNSNSTMDE